MEIVLPTQKMRAMFLAVRIVRFVYGGVVLRCVRTSKCMDSLLPNQNMRAVFRAVEVARFAVVSLEHDEWCTSTYEEDMLSRPPMEVLMSNVL